MARPPPAICEKRFKFSTRIVSNLKSATNAGTCKADQGVD